MKIRYTGNSGFAVDLGGDLLVFDCFDPIRHPWLFDLASLAKSVTVFVSHSHKDHYSPEIAQFTKVCSPKFILSDDVPKLSGSIRVKSGETLSVNGLYIRVFGSTDAGVSFYVRHLDAALFHAGDLNNWHWMDESSPHEIEKAEEDFLMILGRISEEIVKMDAAFFPVDPRMGTDHYKGAVQFAVKMKPRVLIPMHFGNSFDPSDEFYHQIEECTKIVIPNKAEWTIIDQKEY